MYDTTQLKGQYKLLGDWYISVLEDIREEDEKKIIQPNSNSLQWIAGHLIVGRYRQLLRLGLKMEPYIHLNKFVNQSIPPPNAIAFSDSIEYPRLAECRLQWREYSKLLMEALDKADEKILNAEINFSPPTGGKTVLSALTFISLHEAYHIGQMSIIRKSLGYKSMQIGARK